MTDLMPAGTYYVGDLCYVLGSRWDEVCAKVILERSCRDGVFTLEDGTQFAMFSTAYGDGGYYDQHGKSYCVDSGSIGAVLVNANGIELSRADTLGNIVEFKHDFLVFSEDGKIQIGHLEIDTDPDYEGDIDESQEWEDYDADC